MSIIKKALVCLLTSVLLVFCYGCGEDSKICEEFSVVAEPLQVNASSESSGGMQFLGKQEPEIIGPFGEESVSFYGYKDSETGVYYIVAYQYSGHGMGLAITPRYNADGTLYTD